MKKSIIIICTILIFICSAIVKNSYNKLYEEKKENPYFAYYIEGKEVSEMPLKDSTLTLSKDSTCNNGVTISWDDDTWSAKINYTNYVK